MANERFFPYAVDWRFALMWMPFLLAPDRDGVRLDGEELVATYGLLRLATPVANLAGAHVTRAYRWWTAIGARRSFVDDGLTFGTNHDAGVCIHFREPVPSPLKRSGHSALTVTVRDLDPLAEAITALAAR